MLFDKKFDLIFSLGEDCACTSSYLWRFNLQEYSYPFDLFAKAVFLLVQICLSMIFKGFLEKENLTQLDKSTFNGSVNEFNDYYWDKSTNFYFYHNFDIKIPF